MGAHRAGGYHRLDGDLVHPLAVHHAPLDTDLGHQRAGGFGVARATPTRRCVLPGRREAPRTPNPRAPNFNGMARLVGGWRFGGDKPTPRAGRDVNRVHELPVDLGDAIEFMEAEATVERW